MNDEKERIAELEKKLAAAKAEIKKLEKKLLKGRMLQSNLVDRIVIIEADKNRIGPTTNDPYTGQKMLQSHDQKTKSLEERRIEILQRVQEKREKEKTKKEA